MAAKAFSAEVRRSTTRARGGCVEPDFNLLIDCSNFVSEIERFSLVDLFLRFKCVEEGAPCDDDDDEPAAAPPAPVFASAEFAAAAAADLGEGGLVLPVPEEEEDEEAPVDVDEEAVEEW